MGVGGRYTEDMDRMAAFQRGMTTWANWVDLNVDPAKTRVFFQSMSPTHYRYATNCYSHLFSHMTLSGWTYLSLTSEYTPYTYQYESFNCLCGLLRFVAWA